MTGTRGILAVIVVLVAVAIAASVATLHGSSAGGLSAPEPTVADVAPTVRIDDVATPASDVDRRVVEAEAPVPSKAATAFVPAPNAEDSADSTWIEGRVEFPPGTPGDESVRVAVTVTPLSDNLLPEPLGGFPVAADRRFRIPIPSRFWWTVELEIEGRHLFLERPRTVDMSALPSELVLRPYLGAVARVRFVPSAAMLARGFDPGQSTANVLATNPMRDFLRQQRTTTRDATGTVEVGAIRPGVAHQFRAYADGALPHVTELPPFRAGEVREIELALTAAPRIAGTVRDERGAPVGGARLLLRTANSAPSLQPGYATTDADGRFVIHATAEGEARLHVEREGFVAAELGPWTMNVGFELADFPVVLSSGTTISGRVRWPDGSAAASVWVAALPAGKDSAVAPFPPFEAGTRVLTEADGSFRFAGLDAEPRTLTALVSARLDRSDSKSRRVAWTARASILRLPADGVELVLAPGSVVRGRVVDDLGAPVADALVVANPSAPVQDDSSSTATSDASGGFELAHVRDGGWRVVAQRPRSAFSPPVTFVVAAPEVPDVRIVVPRPARLAGRVLDPTGVPAGGTEVDIELPDASSSGRSWRPHAITAADGTFLVEGLPPGPLRARARKIGHARSLEVAVTLTATETTSGVELVLRAGGTVEGVLLAADGTPIPNEEVALYREDVPWSLAGRASSDEQGRFRFENVEPGAVLLPRPGLFDPPDRYVVEEGASKHVVVRAR